MSYAEKARQIVAINGWETMTCSELSNLLGVSPNTVGAVIRYHKKHNRIALDYKPQKRTHNALIREMLSINGWETINPADLGKMLGCKTITARVILWKKKNNPWLGMGTGRKSGEPHWSKRVKVEQTPNPFVPIVPIVPAFGNVLSWKNKDVEKPIKIKPKKEYDPCFCGECPLGKQSDECYQIEMAGRPRIDKYLNLINSKSLI